MTPDAFKAEVERYLAITQMSATKFGTLAANDPRFVFDLRKKNREPRTPTMRRVTDFMSRPAPEQRRAG